MKEHIILASLWMVYCLLHSFMASLRFKQWVKNWLGDDFKYYRLFYTIFSFAGLGAIIYYQVALPSAFVFHQSVFLTAVGAVIAMSGLALMLVCIKKYFLSLSGLKSLFQESYGGELMVRGIHRYMRHPLYLGTFLFIWGLFLLFPNLSLLIANTIITVYTLLAIRLEEYKLIAEFGEAYKRYQQSVPALVPALRLKKEDLPK